MVICEPSVEEAPMRQLPHVDPWCPDGVAMLPRFLFVKVSSPLTVKKDVGAKTVLLRPQVDGAAVAILPCLALCSTPCRVEIADRTALLTENLQLLLGRCCARHSRLNPVHVFVAKREEGGCIFLSRNLYTFAAAHEVLDTIRQCLDVNNPVAGLDRRPTDRRRLRWH